MSQTQMRAEQRTDPKGDLQNIDRAKMANHDLPDGVRWMWSVIGTLEDKQASDADCLDEFRKAMDAWSKGTSLLKMCHTVMGTCVQDRPHLFKEMCKMVTER